MAFRENIDPFFDTVRGFAIEALISDGNKFSRRINVIFDQNSQAVDVYGETNVEAGDPSFQCKSTDLNGVARGMTVKFPNARADEEGYGKSYRTERFVAEEPGVTRVHLTEL